MSNIYIQKPYKKTMKVQNCNYGTSNLSFTSANINIKALSDSHGQLYKLAPLYENMVEAKNIPADKKGEANVLSIVGDWFISESENSCKTINGYTSGDYQLAFFNEFVKKMNESYKNLTTLFVPGNHEFDAGAQYINKLFENMDAKIIATNIDIKESDALKGTRKKKKLYNSYIVEVEDNKNPNLKHKALFLGITPVNMQYYKKNLEGVKFTDNVLKSKSKIKPEDYIDTIIEIDKQIKDFKKTNPKGAVVVMCHAGSDFTKNLIDMNSDIDLVLNAHDHLKQCSSYKGVPVINLYREFKKWHDIKLHFNDNGKLDRNIVSHAHYPENNKLNSYFTRFYNTMYKKDTKKDISVSTNKNLKTLSNDGVRYSNSHLANFITDSILAEIKKVNPSVEIFALNASAIRGEIPTDIGGKASNIDIANVLSGITPDDAELYTNDVSGKELLNIIRKNIEDNTKAPESTPLMHFSGVTIDKNYLLQNKDSTYENFYKYIKVNGKELKPDETYKMANVDKFYAKSKNPVVKELQKSRDPLNLNAKDLFLKHMEQGKKAPGISVKCENRIY